MTWRPWQPIVRREVWHGRPWVAIPVYVVSDEPELLVTYMPERAPFGFADGDWPGGRHGWQDRDAWEGHGCLHLQRPRDPYAVFVFWHGPQRSFECWYLNLQDPFRRSALGIDTLDHVLDLYSADAHNWTWKDEERLPLSIAKGRFTKDETDAIRRDAERVELELTERGPWWDLAWAEWQPPSGLTPPALPDGWELVPAA